MEELRRDFQDKSHALLEVLNKLELLRFRGRDFDSFDNKFRQQMEAIRYQLKNGATSDEAFEGKLQRIQDDRTARHMIADSAMARQLLKQQLAKASLCLSRGE